MYEEQSFTFRKGDGKKNKVVGGSKDMIYFSKV
jgi:hypothetical protein